MSNIFSAYTNALLADASYVDLPREGNKYGYRYI